MSAELRGTQVLDRLGMHYLTAPGSVRGAVDFIHVAEYVWGAAWSFFDKGDADAETWVAGQLTKILHGKAGDVAAGIRRRATRFGYSSAERKGADEAADYLTSKKPYLDYAPPSPPDPRAWVLPPPRTNPQAHSTRTRSNAWPLHRGESSRARRSPRGSPPARATGSSGRPG